jgi:NTE family protein
VSAPSKSVSLALGGGGARGLAHIGAIQWLGENGYTIRSIAGSSMGAVVGGIYATGKLDLYAEWVLALERMKVVRLLDLALARAGLFKLERIMGILRELIGDCDIEELPISFTAVATDLESGEEVWLRRGKLFDAIRASIATPLIFTPFLHGSRILLDGALINPVPISATIGDSTDLTIAVSLSGADALRPARSPSAPLAEGKAYQQRLQAFIGGLRRTRAPEVTSRGMFDIALGSMEVMQRTIGRLNLARNAPDVMVEIPGNACGFLEFWRAGELIALGRERTAHAFAKTRI